MRVLLPSRARRIALALALAALGIAGASTSASAVTVTFRMVASGFTKPVFVTNARDGRLFIVEQAGRIKVRQTTGAISTFLDIRDRVNDVGHEQGLFSVAFHPNYARSGTWGYLRFYVNYTNAAGDVVLSEFKRLSTNPNRAYLSSERILLTIPHPTYINHNGGTVAFGPDWLLYMSIGDGGGGDSHNNAQWRGSLLGKVIRINPQPEPESGLNYTIPPDNPFYALPTGRKEIWAYGLRNPWRFSFDPSRGDMYVADVGQSRYEEVNRARANSSRLNGGRGRNYGWDCYEAYATYDYTNCTSTSKTFPAAVYAHGVPEVNCAVTGGYVDRRSTSALYRRYLFGDFCSGRIWSINADSTLSRQTPVLLRDTAYHISSFGRGSTGRLYISDLYTGGVYEILGS
jgi:glucose/arabinose dehydrogenase